MVTFDFKNGWDDCAQSKLCLYTHEADGVRSVLGLVSSARTCDMKRRGGRDGV